MFIIEEASGKTYTTSKLPTHFDDRVHRGGRENPALADDVLMRKGNHLVVGLEWNATSVLFSCPSENAEEEERRKFS
jgi:hypothetical protein